MCLNLEATGRFYLGIGVQVGVKAIDSLSADNCALNYVGLFKGLQR